MLESKIQNKIIKFLESKGYIVIKLINTNWNWIPDLIVLIGWWKHFWIEAKQEKWVTSEIQKYRHKQLRLLWDTIIVPHGYEDFIEQYKEIYNIN